MDVEAAIQVGNVYRTMTGVPLAVTAEKAERVAVKNPFGSVKKLKRSTVEHAIKTYRWS